MHLSKKFNELEQLATSIIAVCNEAKTVIEEAKNAWPDHQIVSEGVVWHTREEPMPAGIV